MARSRGFSAASMVLLISGLIILTTGLIFHFRHPTTPPRLHGLSKTPDVDVLTATVRDLQALLENGKVTSQELVKLYLAQIQKHNHFGMRLNALITVAPEETALSWAKAMDEERAVSGMRGPLHGIPLVVKDNTCTPSLGMQTTCGSFALVGAKAKRDAIIVERLVAAGAIVIGKANLSEWSNFKDVRMVAGWSAVGGQTQSPYVRGGVTHDAIYLGHSTPCGSSSGSAVAVAAGFVPVAIGTESDGSLVQPSTRAGLYGLKATIGSIPIDGCQANVPAFSSSGGMAKSVGDLADVLSVLMAEDDLSRSLTHSWKGQRVGFVDFDLWQPADDIVEPNEDFKVQTYAAMNNAIARIRAKGAKISRNVPLITLEQSVEGCDVKKWDDVYGHGIPENMAKFLSLFDGTPVKTVEDLIAFNEKNAAIELPPDHPGQQRIINALNSTMPQDKWETGLNCTRSNISNAIHKVLDDYGVDVIMGPADAHLAGVAAGAGFPVASVPLGYADFNGRAFGMNIIGAAGSEATMLNVMSAWEKTFPEGRMPPPMLVHWDATVGWNSGGGGKLLPGNDL